MEYSARGAPDPGLPPMTPRQQAVFDDLLAIGAERPYAPVGLVSELRETLTGTLAAASSRWTEPSLWLSKSTVMSVRRCEAGFLAARAQAPTQGKFPSAAAGDLTHRAIQLAYTHPGAVIADYVAAALTACRASDEAFEELWSTSDMASQSDILMSATSKVTNFLDSWPQIRPSWEPRFEEPVQVVIGKATLSARVDLLLGRPRATGQQSMLVVDWKSGGLHDYHAAEARYHALLAALSFGVPPFRSLVYSLTSGEYTEPDVTAQMLRTAAQELAQSVTSIVDLLTERREPRVRCGQGWCQACAPSKAGQALAA